MTILLTRKPMPHDAVDGPTGLMRRLDRLCDVLEAAASETDAAMAIPQRSWEALARSGVLKAPLSQRDGGEDLTAPDRHRDLMEVLRRLGAVDLSIARLVEGHLNAILLVRRFGTATQVAAMAAAVAAGALAGVWGADDAAGLSVTPAGGGWQLAGRKIFASGAGFVTHPVVIARSDEGQRMILPRLRAGERADVTAWTAQGMRSTATGSVDFTGLPIDAGQFLGEPGAFMCQPGFSGGAWRFCAAHLGAAERLVDLFRAHLVSRQRDADPYQVQRVAHCVAATTTAAFWICDAARRVGDPAADATATVAFVNMTRMVTERAALDVLEAVHRGVGLGGFMRPHPIERISRDLATYLRQPVPDLAMADAARFALADPRPTARLWGGSDEG